MYRSRRRCHCNRLVDLHRRRVILERCVLVLLALMKLPVSVLCFTLYDFFLLVHSVRLHFPIPRFALAHFPFPVGICWLRSRMVLLLLRLRLRLRLLLLLLQRLRYPWQRVWRSLRALMALRRRIRRGWALCSHVGRRMLGLRGQSWKRREALIVGGRGV